MLPTTIQKQQGTVLNTVAPEKDVDAFHTLNIGKYQHWYVCRLCICTLYEFTILELREVIN